MTIICADTNNSLTLKGKKSMPSKIDIQTIVHQAATSIAPVWPLKTFIACNPLQGFESQPFESALKEAAFLFDQGSVDYQDINRETIKWCGVYFDQGQSVITMPTANQGFYSAFKALAIYDAKLHQSSKQNKQWLNRLPEHAEDAIIECLELLQVPAQDHLSFLKKSLAQLPGWSGYIKRLSVWQNTPNQSLKQASEMVNFLAVRLIITLLLQPEINSAQDKEPALSTPQYPQMDQIKQQEEGYQSQLIPKLLKQASQMNQSMKPRAEVQLAFCIDVRSEPFRRHLESLGAYETFGTAGFFGLPIRLHDYNSGHVSDSCPVLLKPQYDIHDGPSHPHNELIKQHQHGKKILEILLNLFQQLKYNFATPFALVETLGACCGLLMLSKTMQPMLTYSAINKAINTIKPKLVTTPMVDKTASNNSIAEEQQILFAESALRIIGLTEDFASYVIFCGHGSATQNNAYASGLDCGACGGNEGGGNAKVLASILNKGSIRNALAERGIHIPDHTEFLAGEHNTTTDDLEIFQDPQAPLRHAKVFHRLQDNLIKAKEKNTASRAANFGLSRHFDAIQETQQRSQDWSEVRPEWGLARNAGFIVGPRQLTQALDLEGRCFLHSYDWTKDETLSYLETILTAPMVVAEWINTQYLLSTFDNINYGSGSKITHNVSGKMGVMQGNASDLMHGLPLQSVKAADDLPYHQAQRLLTVIYAPREQVTTLINRQEILKTLFFNAWVHVIVIEPSENQAYRLQTNGAWQLISGADASDEVL